MKASSPDLAPIPWVRPPNTPLPDVILDDSPEAWAVWDAAKANQDVQAAA